MLVKARKWQEASMKHWALRSREIIDQAYQRYEKNGTAVAILFRGLPNMNERDFSEWVNNLGYEPFPYVGGVVPRNEIQPNVSEGAQDDNIITLEPHNEMAYSPRFPKIEKDEKLAERTIKVKISGDGAKMTRVTNFIIISFSIVNDENTVMSAKDILTKSLVNQALGWDAKENLNKAPKDRTTKHLPDLTNSVRECGITFDVWEKKDEDGRGSGVYDLTSLMGSYNKILMKSLPEKLPEILKPGRASESVVKRWKDLNEIYKMMNECNPSNERIKEFFEKARTWVQLFVSLGGEVTGFGKQQVTPYMHCLVYHVPQFMKKHNGMRKFSKQGVEKNNDDARRYHLTKSNKWDAPKDILLGSKRQQLFDIQHKLFEEVPVGW